MIIPNHFILYTLILQALPPISPLPVNNYSHTFTEIFEILNINPTSNKRDTTVAFRTLIRIYHPDKYYNNTKELT